LTTFFSTSLSTFLEYLVLSLEALFFENKCLFSALSKTACTLAKFFLSGLARNILTISFNLFLKTWLSFLFLTDFLSDFFADLPIGISRILSYRQSIYNNLQ